MHKEKPDKILDFSAKELMKFAEPYVVKNAKDEEFAAAQILLQLSNTDCESSFCNIAYMIFHGNKKFRSYFIRSWNVLHPDKDLHLEIANTRTVVKKYL